MLQDKHCHLYYVMIATKLASSLLLLAEYAHKENQFANCQHIALKFLDPEKN